MICHHVKIQIILILFISCTIEIVRGWEHFAYPNFRNRPHLNINGDAKEDYGAMALTLPQPFQVGAFWFSKSVSVEKGFSTDFQFRILEIDNEGGEGFAFVFHKNGPYTIGNGGDGLGYDGLSNAFAIEFDTNPNTERGDPEYPHISVHDGLLGTVSASEVEGTSYVKFEDLKSYDEIPTNYDMPRNVRIDYIPGPHGRIDVTVSHPDPVTKDLSNIDAKISYSVANIEGPYYFGFTSSTSKSFAKFTITNWKFRGAGDSDTESISSLDSKCSADFDGPACTITNEVARNECPRRKSCNVCVEDVYNCVWCSTSDAPPSCVVGVRDETRQCHSMGIEPLSCSAGLSRTWLYVLGMAIVVVMVFSVLLYKTLPLVQSFRAISILVALVGGGLFGMFISFIVSVSLVEISESPFISIAYGIFFVVHAVAIAIHTKNHIIPYHGICNSHSLLLILCASLVFISGMACFLLDKRFVHWLPEVPKVMLYTTLGACLNFSLVLSVSELGDVACARCYERDNPNIRSSVQSSQEKLKLASVTSQARVALLAVSSLLSGMFFGLMFGTLRIEEESQYRVALALQQETSYTYPVGAVIGGVSAVLYHLIQLPQASDDDIDRLMRSNDGL